MTTVEVTKGKLEYISDAVVDLVLKKNHDYGDAWQRYGIFTPLIRINDKILRLKTLASVYALVVDEGIEDTLKDIIGYALLALLYIQENSSLSYEDKLQLVKKIVDEDNEDGTN
jgi:Na+-translocating ferredoxin:NAD+ oxidoreductase RnfA subunit